MECRQFRLKVTALCFKGKKEEGSSATDYVTDVTDVTDIRMKDEGRKSRVLAIKYILTVGAATIILKGYCGLMEC